jgi:hypothetical protein
MSELKKSLKTPCFPYNDYQMYLPEVRPHENFIVFNGLQNF